MLNHEYLKPANFLSPKLASTLQRNINLNAILPIFQPPRPFHHLVCRLFIQQPSGPAAAWGQANWALGCHGLSQNGTYDEQNAQFLLSKNIWKVFPASFSQKFYWPYSFLWRGTFLIGTLLEHSVSFILILNNSISFQ